MIGRASLDALFHHLLIIAARCLRSGALRPLARGIRSGLLILPVLTPLLLIDFQVLVRIELFKQILLRILALVLHHGELLELGEIDHIVLIRIHRSEAACRMGCRGITGRAVRTTFRATIGPTIRTIRTSTFRTTHSLSGSGAVFGAEHTIFVAIHVVENFPTSIFGKLGHHRRLHEFLERDFFIAIAIHFGDARQGRALHVARWRGIRIRRCAHRYQFSRLQALAVVFVEVSEQFFLFFGRQLRNARQLQEFFLGKFLVVIGVGLFPKFQRAHLFATWLLGACFGGTGVFLGMGSHGEQEKQAGE